MTRRFIVEIEQDEGSLKQNYSTDRDRQTLPGGSSGIAATGDSSVSGSLSDNKRHKTCSYRIKTILIESISWQLLYAAHLLAFYELVLTTKEALISPALYSWLPLEAVIAIGWLLKSYWNPDSAIFNLTEQPDASQLIGRDCPFAATTVMFGSGNNPPQYTASESPSQQTSQTTAHRTGALTSPMNYGSDGGKGGFQQQHHTLGLNCFIYFCHGICQFGPSSDNRGFTEWPQCFAESSCPYSADGDCLGCKGIFDLANTSDSGQNKPFQTLNGPFGIRLPFDSNPLFDDNSAEGVVTDLMISGAANTAGPAEPLNDDVPIHGASIAIDFEVISELPDLHDIVQETGFSLTHSHSEAPQTTTELSQLYQRQTRPSPAGATQAEDNSGQLICSLTVVGEDGQYRLCGKVCNNTKSLSDHKNGIHSGQKTCDVRVVKEDGQQRPCGKVCKNARVLSYHKISTHTGQKTCEVTVTGEDGQRRPCGKVCKNALALSSHKSTYHSGQKTCGYTVVGEDGQPRPCGKVCQSGNALFSHKSKCHAGKKTCEAKVIGEDGRQRPCGKVCKNALALSSHKSNYHTGQQTCDVAVVGENGRQRPCAMLCKNVQTLLYHKRRDHTGQQTCYVNVIGEDGQLRPCGKVFKNASLLSGHKSGYHSGQKNCDLTVAGKDGRQRPCGKVFNNIPALSDHKRKYHTGPKNCDLALFGKDGQQRPCGTVWKNARALINHRRRDHSEQKTCNLTVIGEDGQQRQCGRICKNALALTVHKRIHRKRKSVDLDRDNDSGPQEGKVNK